MIRFLCSLAAFLLLAVASSRAASADAPPPRLGSSAFRFEDLAVKASGVGERRDVADLPTATLERFECHISTLNPGLPSHPPHRHAQEELIILKTGTLEVFINGRTERIGPGSLFFFASNDLHAVRNVGSTPATYLVFNVTTARTRTVPAAPAAESAPATALRSAVFDWEKLAVTPTKTGARRAVFDSPTVTCARLECHVTTLQPGASPHAGHRHPDEEIVVVKEGVMTATFGGATHTGGPGSIFFFASNDEHALRNAGASPATYYILRVVTEATPAAAKWISLFNGRDLEGWTVKVAKHPIGENYRDTFRVEDGVIKVSYDRYGKFDGQFAHLYTNQAYAHYILRVDYRLTGEVMPDAPKWTAQNSGVMLHAQSPLSMTLDQSWPVSLEGQFLAIGTQAGRQTGNVCTPGTDVEVNGKLTKAHIVEATGKLYPLDQWVTFEAEVHGHEEIIYRVNGVEVLRYQHPQLDPTEPDAQRLLAAGVSKRLGFGHIALQAEGNPVWFRNIRLLPLDE